MSEKVTPREASASKNTDILIGPIPIIIVFLKVETQRIHANLQFIIYSLQYIRLSSYKLGMS